jgi:hypothetical protein
MKYKLKQYEEGDADATAYTIQSTYYAAHKRERAMLFNTLFNQAYERERTHLTLGLWLGHS